MELLNYIRFIMSIINLNKIISIIIVHFLMIFLYNIFLDF